MVAMSKRQVDSNGWINIAANPLTKAGVFQYLGSEIGAPEPDRVYNVYRPSEELQSPETIESFKLVPFIDEHTWLGEDGEAAERKGVQGIIGESIYFEEPYLFGNVRILSESIKDRINAGKVELSAGYKCKYDFEDGAFNGQKYDAIQRDIRANHLALVDKGRSGADVAVLDKLTITFDTAELLPMTPEEILAAIAALSDEARAALLAELVPTQDETKEDEVTDEPTPVETAEDDVEESANNVEEAAEAASEELDILKGEIAKLKEQVATTDTGALLREISKRDALASRVSEFVGTFDHVAMTAKQVAEYGVQKLGVKCEKGSEVIALDAWLQGRIPEHKQKRAQDSAVRGNTNKFWQE